uniref:Uncharacterized protein n=1 Tax=Cucumis melo TaxID=3656 RepID=A0A9I9EMH7_CUCME
MSGKGNNDRTISQKRFGRRETKLIVEKGDEVDRERRQTK